MMLVLEWSLHACVQQVSLGHVGGNVLVRTIGVYNRCRCCIVMQIDIGLSLCH
jgi:hypothetical protein